MQKFTSDDLLIAIEADALHLVDEILQSGVDPNAEGGLPLKSPFGLMDGPRYIPLLLAAERGNIQMIKLLLTHGAEIDRASDYGYTALIEAAAAGKLEAVKFLVENGARIDRKVRSGNTAATYARDARHPAVVKYLKEVMKARTATGTARQPEVDERLGIETFNGHIMLILVEAAPKAVSEALQTLQKTSSPRHGSYGQKLTAASKAQYAVFKIRGQRWSIIWGLSPDAFNELTFGELARTLSTSLGTRSIAYGHSDVSDAMILHVFRAGHEEHSLSVIDGVLQNNAIAAAHGGDYQDTADHIVRQLGAFIPACAIGFSQVDRLEIESLAAEDVDELFVLSA